MKKLDYTNRTKENSTYDEWHSWLLEYMSQTFQMEVAPDLAYNAYAENYELGDTPKEAIDISLNHAQ